jgi:hypothetical protein
MNKDRAALVSTLSILFILSVTNVPMELYSAVNYFTHVYKKLTFLLSEFDIFQIYILVLLLHYVAQAYIFSIISF